MHIGQYIPGASLIHRLDPRVKIASTVVLSILSLKGGVSTLVLISMFMTLLVPLSHSRATHMARAFRPVLIFFVLLFSLHLFFTKGNPIPPFPPWPVTVTYEGLYKGLVVIWQFALLILGASFLAMTTSPTALVSGMERLLRPFQKIGVPSHDLALMVSIALRFVPTFLEEIDRIKAAQMARGPAVGSGPLQRRIRSTVSLLPPLMQRAFQRADDLVSAMEARGYRRGPRTYMTELCMGRADYAAIAVVALITGVHVMGS